MSYIIIEAPALTDEAAVNLQDFFYKLIDAVEKHYHNQTERYYREKIMGSMVDRNVQSVPLTEGEPPF